ncbi:MAG: T9SS type A sorting domain-containing protein [Candidatus Latescibacterota bacterium]
MATLVDRVQEPGEYAVPWAVPDLGSGVYICRLTAGGRRITRRLVLLE